MHLLVNFESNDNCEDLGSFLDGFGDSREDWIEALSFSTAKAYLCKVGETSTSTTSRLITQIKRILSRG